MAKKAVKIFQVLFILWLFLRPTLPDFTFYLILWLKRIHNMAGFVYVSKMVNNNNLKALNLLSLAYFSTIFPNTVSEIWTL
jgi:hypothetical protein